MADTTDTNLNAVLQLAQMTQGLPRAHTEEEPFWMYIDERQQQRGPISTCDLRYFIAASQITTNTYGWAEGMANWAILAQIPELVPIFLEVGSLLETGWFYMDDARYKRGPYAPEFMKQLYVSGQIDDDTLAWRPDQLVWAPLKRILDLVLPSNENQSKSNGGHSLAPASATRHPEVHENETKQTTVVHDDEEKEEEEEEDESARDQAVNERMNQGGIDVATDLALGNKRNVPLADEELTQEQLLKREANRERRKRAKMEKNIALLERINRSNLYVEGLPTDWAASGLTDDKVAEFFRRAGLIKVDDQDQPKIKLYRLPSTTSEPGAYKGDALVSYLKPESVDIALDILDGQEIVPGYPVKLSRAQLDRGDGSVDREQLAAQGAQLRHQLARMKRSGAAQAKAATQQQALDWDEGENEGGFKIVLIQGMYTIDEALAARGIKRSDSTEAAVVPVSDRELALAMDLEHEGVAQYYDTIKDTLRAECETKCGPVKKISIFPGNTTGPVVIQFRSGAAAKACLALMAGRVVAGRKITAQYYDGKTNLKVKAPYIPAPGESLTPALSNSHSLEDEEAEQLDADELREQARIKAFGDWLENQ